MTNVAVLDVEEKYYDEHFEEFKKNYPERFLLIKGRELVGDFGAEDESVDAGVNLFGKGPFLVRRAGEKKTVLFAPALSLGIWNAQPEL